MDHVFAAAFAGEIGTACGRDERDLVFILDKRLSAESDRGIADIGNDIDITFIEPATDDSQANVGLVLMIGNEQLDLDVRILGNEFVDCQLRASDTGRPLNIAIDASHIGNVPDADRIGCLRARGACGPDNAGRSETTSNKHATIDFHVHSITWLRVENLMSSSNVQQTGSLADSLANVNRSPERAPARSVKLDKSRALDWQVVCGGSADRNTIEQQFHRRVIQVRGDLEQVLARKIVPAFRYNVCAYLSCEVGEQGGHFLWIVVRRVFLDEGEILLSILLCFEFRIARISVEGHADQSLRDFRIKHSLQTADRSSRQYADWLPLQFRYFTDGERGEPGRCGSDKNIC